jgi:hypothetical protein
VAGVSRKEVGDGVDAGGIHGLGLDRDLKLRMRQVEGNELFEHLRGKDFGGRFPFL